ncbi:hypothetical protein G9A89_003393 [Geosiphon pyriformis]|nr:hypothetical protein G9A89_003393 [Geosiphon pyriformis]
MSIIINQSTMTTGNTYLLLLCTTAPLINFEEEKPKPTWEAYQVLWADEEHNKLPPILSWDDNGKKKQTNELTWETDDLTWNNE